MEIQWFPGHMNKTLKQIDIMQKKVDFVVYVLDARAPFSCVNPSITRIVENKPILFLLTKKDLANQKETKLWVEYFSKNGNYAMAVDATKSLVSKEVSKAIEIMLSDRIEKQKQKGVFKIFRGMVVGIPNSGKSTLINTMSGSAKTKTGDKAGVTKSVQWVKLPNGMDLLDTPGTLWPKLENKFVAENLAFLGSVKDEILDTSELAFALIEKLKKVAPNLLKDRYSISNLDLETILIFDEICKNRGFILKKNEIDYERGGKAILDDFRKGRIGNITLDVFGDINGKRKN